MSKDEENEPSEEVWDACCQLAKHAGCKLMSDVITAGGNCATVMAVTTIMLSSLFSTFVKEEKKEAAFEQLVAALRLACLDNAA